MDEEKILIIVKGEDKTTDVEQLSKDENNKICIKYYNNDKIYPYCSFNIIIREKSILIELKEKDVYYKNQIVFNIQKIIRFEEYIKIIYKTRRNRDI